MTKNKDLKRLIRTRMKKTGESYTAARAVVVGKQDRDQGYAAPRSKWAELAGMSNDAVHKKTGRTWPEWVEVLDEVSAFREGHPAIAKHITATYPEIGGWWAQTVTVGYERIRGLREVGQQRSGTYDANKSKTFAVAIADLYPMFKDARRRKRWLPDGVAKVRSSAANKSLRVDWDDGTRVSFYFVTKPNGKSAVQVQHTLLSTREDIPRVKDFWEERLNTLRDLMR